MAALANPGLPGSFSFDTVIYASAGSNYGGVPALSQYTIYDTPDPAYVTPRINISVFANLGIGAPWPFPNTSVPLNGHVCIPRGRGPFPPHRVIPRELGPSAHLSGRRLRRRQDRDADAAFADCVAGRTRRGPERYPQRRVPVRSAFVGDAVRRRCPGIQLIQFESSMRGSAP